MKPASVITAAAMLAGSAAPAIAASDSMTVTATVLPSCSVEAGDLAFGTLNARAATATGEALVQLECTPGTAYSIALDEGRHGGRRMANATRGAFLSYEIYRDRAGLQRWGSTASTAVAGVAPADGRVRLNAYGQVTVERALAGDYSDVVTVSVAF